MEQILRNDWVLVGASLALGAILGWLARRPKPFLPPARGRALDLIAMDKFGMERESWIEKFPIFGDGPFRQRVRRAYDARSRWTGTKLEVDQAGEPRWNSPITRTGRTPS